MALKAMVKTLDSIAEAQRPLYRKDGELFVLDVEPVEGFALEHVEGLKRTLGESKQKHENALEKLKAYEGLDAAKAREAIDRLDKLTKGEPDEKTKAQLEVREKAIKDKFTADLSKAEQRASQLLKQVEALTLDNGIKDALVKHKGNVALLMPHVRAQVTLKQDGESLVPVVLGKDGNPRISPKSGSTANMTIDELVQEMSANVDFAPGFAGNGATGTQGRLPEGSRNDKPKTVHYSQSEALERFANTL